MLCFFKACWLLWCTMHVNLYCSMLTKWGLHVFARATNTHVQLRILDTVNSRLRSPGAQPQALVQRGGCASTSLPSNTNAPIWSMSIEIHIKFLLGRLLLSAPFECMLTVMEKRVGVPLLEGVLLLDNLRCSK